MAGLASAALVAAWAGAVPPPVEVTPLIVTADPQAELAREVAALVHGLGGGAHLIANPVPAETMPPDCRLDDAERDRCFAAAAREMDLPTAVYVVAEPAGDRVRFTCVGQDSARSQQAELSIAVAAGSDAQAALQARSALAGCIIGALHAPPRA